MDPNASAFTPGQPAAAVILYGLGASAREFTADQVGGPLWIAGSAAEVLDLLGGREVAVVALGGELQPLEAKELLAAAWQRYPVMQTCHVVFAAGPELTLFQEEVDADQVFYLTPKPPPPADVLPILKSAVQRYQAKQSTVEATVFDAPQLERALAVVRLLAAETRLESAVPALARAALEFLDVDRAHCLLYDARNETLWSREHPDAEERRESAAAGVVSFVVRTGQSVRLDRVGEDPRYEPEVDNQSGPQDERFLAVPLAEPLPAAMLPATVPAALPATVPAAPPRRILAVLVARRSGAAAPFSSAEQQHLEFLADQAAPVLGRLLLQTELDALATRRLQGPEESPLFRQEAIAHHSRGMARQGHVLELSPRWTQWAYPFLWLVLLAALLFGIFGSLHEYATGLAVVQIDDRTDVTATLPGTVTAVAVEPGQKVAAGQLLVRFYGVQEAAELAALEHQFELGLAERLRNPADVGVAQALTALRSQRELARTRLEERSLRATRAGVVSDLRIRPGQHLATGQVVLSLADEAPALSIIALLPGHYRPLLKAGQMLRLELQGYPYAYQHLTVSDVGAEVIGPSEVRRVLGPGIADALTVSGPVVVVRALLPARTFLSNGRSFAFYDGMQASAEVRVRSEPIVIALIPGLKALWSERG